jgi:hypothetical protein
MTHIANFGHLFFLSFFFLKKIIHQPAGPKWRKLHVQPQEFFHGMTLTLISSIFLVFFHLGLRLMREKERETVRERETADCN